MKILYTAFKGIHNTSYQLVSDIAQKSLFLTNSFRGLETDLSFVDEHFDLVIMFGVDKRLINRIRIETCAEYNGEVICTKFDTDLLEISCRRKQIMYSISHSSTGYLCNAAYYHMLKKVPNTVFVHIPSAKGMNEELMKKLTDCFKEYPIS